MALQKVVNIDPAIGVPGSQAAFLGEVITVQNYLSVDPLDLRAERH